MRTRPMLLLSLLLLFPLPAFADDAPAEKGSISKDRLKAHVDWLASPQRKGRGAWTDREACSKYIAKAFTDAGLKPLPGHDSMFFDTPGVKEPALRNVVAWLPGPAGAEGEYVILSAHYDHLGQQVKEIKTADGGTMRTTTTFHGADDNATGVAALLEIARVLGAKHAADPKAFPRSLVFVSFDLEERNLVGSRQYAKNPPLPLERCAAFLTMDQLGRSLADLTPGSLFLMGTESCAALDADVRASKAPAGGFKAILGIDFQPGYSDYVAFMEAKVPYVFVTSGACADYHQPGDMAQKVDHDQLLARTNWVRDLTMRIVGAKERPTWRDGVEPSTEEIETLRGLLIRVQESLAKDQSLPPMVGQMVGNYANFLGKMLEDGKVTPEERTSAKNGILSLFRMAMQMASR